MRIAFGPSAPEFGSWRWLGADFVDALRTSCVATEFSGDPADIEADVVVFIKFKPPAETLSFIRSRARVVFCPVDIYANAAEIDNDCESLRCSDLVITHCERLERYFSAYSQVSTLHHPLKYVIHPPFARITRGPIVWIGNHSNLQPVAEWVNQFDLPEELWILTDSSINQDHRCAESLGFSKRNRIRLETWSCERHLTWLKLARAALDIKGKDFRARHKPSAKAFDFIASGVPLAMNRGSSSGESVREFGLELARPEDLDHWLSDEYWHGTQCTGDRLRKELSLPQVARHFIDLIRSTSESSKYLSSNIRRCEVTA